MSVFDQRRHKLPLPLPIYQSSRTRCTAKGADSINHHRCWYWHGLFNTLFTATIERKLCKKPGFKKSIVKKWTPSIILEIAQCCIGRCAWKSSIDRCWSEFDTIFDKFFSPIIFELKLTDRVVIDLHNPTLSEQTIQAMKAPTQRFRENYLKNTGVLPETQD